MQLTAPKIKKVNVTDEIVTLYWEKQETATGYVIYRKTNNDTQYMRMGITKNNSFVDTDDIEFVSKFSYYVKAYTKANGNKTEYSEKSDVTSFKSITKSNTDTPMNLEGKYLDQNTFQVTWKKQKNISGYEIVYSNDRDLYEKNIKKLYVEGNQNTSAVIKKLIKNRKYYVQVRPYRAVGIVNYYFNDSRVLVIRYEKNAARYFTVDSTAMSWYEEEKCYETYAYDKNGWYVFNDNTWQSNPEEYDYDLYCDVCGKKGCSNRKTLGYYYQYYYCFKCKKQIWSNDCHPTSHVIYSRDMKNNCPTCGKSSEWVNGESACAHGGCTQWIMDMTCPHCGKFVKANTCHTCKK